MARRYTIQCSVPNTQTRCTLSWTVGGREGGMQGARKEGGWEGGSQGRWGKEGGREGARGWWEREGESKGREGGRKQ